MRVLIYTLLLCIIGGCAKQSTTSLTSSSVENYRKLAYESLDVQPVQFFENAEEDFVIATYTKNEIQAVGAGTLKYIIINIEDEKVVKEGVLPQGTIKWVADYEIEIFNPPGIPKDQTETPDDYKKIYNVKTGKTTKEKGASY